MFYILDILYDLIIYVASYRRNNCCIPILLCPTIHVKQTTALGVKQAGCLLDKCDCLGTAHVSFFMMAIECIEVSGANIIQLCKNICCKAKRLPVGHIVYASFHLYCASTCFSLLMHTTLFVVGL